MAIQSIPGSSTPYAVGSAVGGGTLMSDGSIQYSSSSAAPYSSGGYAYAGNQSVGNVYPQANQGPTSSGQVLGVQAPSQPSGQSSGGAPSAPGSNVNDFNNGWRWDGKTWQPPAGYGQTGSSDADLNAIYDPAMNTINGQESAYRAQYDPAKQAIESGYSQGLAGINTQATDAYGNLDTQGKQVTQDQATAMANARQLYNELAQRNQSMFGSGNSAGQFANELLGRETQKQFGQTTTQTNNAKDAIALERSKVGQWVNDQTNTWNQKKQGALDQLQLSFTNGLQQINAQRGQLESAKAQARLDLLNQAKAQIQQIQAQDMNFQQQLALFQAQKEAQLGAALNTPTVYGDNTGNRITTAPLLTGANMNGGVGVIGENGGFNQSLRYVNQGNGYVK